MIENLTFYLLVYFALKEFITCDCHWTGNYTTRKKLHIIFLKVSRTKISSYYWNKKIKKKDIHLFSSTWSANHPLN